MFFLWAQYYDTMANIVSEQYISIAPILVPLALGGGGVAELWRWYKTRPSDKNFAKFYREVFDSTTFTYNFEYEVGKPRSEELLFQNIRENQKGAVHKISTAEESLFELTKLTAAGDIINKISDVYASNHTRLSCHCKTS